jgi:hypothetical protein
MKKDESFAMMIHIDKILFVLLTNSRKSAETLVRQGVFKS